MRTTRILAAGLAAALSLPALSPPVQAAPAADEKLIVEGVRLPRPQSEVAASVTVVSREEIEALGVDFVAEALATVPGVTVNQTGAFGGQTSVRIRGAASEQTLVLVDGVPVNDGASPGGGFDFARLDPAQIERIEVLRGPQSTFWGTDAIGGVVSITTRRPERGRGGSVFVEGGSFSTFRAGAALQAAGDAGDFRLGVSGLSTDGISKADEDNGNRESDGYEGVSVSGRGGLNLPGGARLDASLLYTDAESEFDRFAAGAQGSVGDGDDLALSEEVAGTVSLRVPTLDGRLEHLLLAGRTELERESLADGASAFSAEAERNVLRYQGTFRAGEAARLAVGAEREEVDAFDDGIAIEGLFALLEANPARGLTLSAGLRRDEHQRFGAETTARLGASWQATPETVVRASWGEGFKAPTLFQTTFFCCGATAPNPDLAPETSEGFDAGVEWSHAGGRAGLALTLFSLETENQIDFDFLTGTYANIRRVDSRGVELSAELALTPWAQAALDYAFVDAENADGDALRRVPRHSGSLVLTVDGGGPFSGTLWVRHNGEEPDGVAEVDGWTRVDLAGRWQATEEVELFARIENLLDAEYQQILGYGTPGRSGTLGLRLRW
ncbi:MAG: TonB-dependent receptor [Pseudomonadales bacterium]|jgi:vitamin B12 transporter|nr:TonB-dependent receptor [Pseudomonadales bacterium]